MCFCAVILYIEVSHQQPKTVLCRRKKISLDTQSLRMRNRLIGPNSLFTIPTSISWCPRYDWFCSVTNAINWPRRRRLRSSSKSTVMYRPSNSPSTFIKSWVFPSSQTPGRILTQRLARPSVGNPRIPLHGSRYMAHPSVMQNTHRLKINFP